MMDWTSWYILSWKLYNSMDESFCVECQEDALGKGAKTGIFNTDQCSQYTRKSFTGVLQSHGIQLSMDGLGLEPRLGQCDYGTLLANAQKR